MIWGCSVRLLSCNALQGCASCWPAFHGEGYASLSWALWQGEQAPWRCGALSQRFLQSCLWFRCLSQPMSSSKVIRND